MAKSTVPVNFKDDIMNSSMGGKRRYKMINNSDGTISLEDATAYDQVGSNFGAAQLNATNQAVNAAADAGKIIDDLDAINNVTQEGYIAGARALKQVNESLGNLVNFSSEEKLIGTWIDGKPLYSKTIQFTPTSNGYITVFFSHGISNVETIYIDGQNSFEVAGTATVPIKLTLGITDAGAIKMEYLFEIMSVDPTNVSYRMAPSGGITSVVLTLRYTKTTD